ncbi:MAG: hypothetical protein ACLPLR_00945 [Terriglobales bacterium]
MASMVASRLIHWLPKARTLPKLLALIFQLDKKNWERKPGIFGRVPGKSVPGPITFVSAKSSSHLPVNMYNLIAFDLCGREQ